MYTSMTGFSKVIEQTPRGVLSLEISSVNHRFQEINIRLPRELSSFEPFLIAEMRRRFVRGKVLLRFELLLNDEYKMATINRALLSLYAEAFIDLNKELNINREIEIERLLSLPGVMEVQGMQEIDQEEIQATLLALLDKAVASWNQMKQVEGQHLKKKIMADLTELKAIIAQVAEKWQGARDTSFSTMKQRVESTLEKMGTSLDPNRYLQEIVILTDKWDVAEEFTRLESHFKKFEAVEQESDSVGRKLDFMVQEINREINTMGTKIQDAEIRALTVDAKAALEKIREQIQNLE
ncbi:MAG: YicC/YloC family endoribonuclease [Synergistaceae bacterium]|nr:YicC/YloC family endoribonuclease [Synergistaceae bacterium]